MIVTRRPHRSPRALLRAIVLATGLLSGTLAAHQAHAALSSCRADPIVTLSNGIQVQMSNTIYDAASNVSKVAYTLHGPKGTTVTSVSYVNTTPGIVETFQYVADNNAGDYDSYAAIYDANAGTNVNYFTSAGSLSQTAQTHLSQSGSVLHIHLHLS